MQQALSSLEDRMAPAEEIFFSWLLRVALAATLFGSAWIDDAPPLELGAWIVTIWVAVRVATQFVNLSAAAPFENGAMNAIFALVAILTLALAFMTVTTLVETVSRSLVAR